MLAARSVGRFSRYPVRSGTGRPADKAMPDPTNALLRLDEKRLNVTQRPDPSTIKTLCPTEHSVRSTAAINQSRKPKTKSHGSPGVTWKSADLGPPRAG
jgi:hypothetical protein